MFEFVLYSLAMLIVLLPVGVVLYRCYRRCPPDSVIVRAGMGGVQVARGHGILVFPSMHISGLLFADPITLQLPNHSIDGPEELAFTVRVGNTADSIHIAAARLLDKDSEDVSRLAADAIFGELSRSTTPTVAGDELESSLQACLGNFGLELVSHGVVE